MDTSDHLNAKDKIKLLLSELQKVGAGYNSGGLTSWSCCADCDYCTQTGPRFSWRAREGATGTYKQR